MLAPNSLFSIDLNEKERPLLRPLFLSSTVDGLCGLLPIKSLD
jgi:hypothetical protein